MPNREPLQWHAEVLPAQWQEAAQALLQVDVTAGFYLAGGTGLALQLGHRRSVDLDLFTARPFQSLDLRDALRATPGFRVVDLADNTLHIEISGVLVSFLHYPYPLLFETRRFANLEAADARDIGCMKLDALSSRGSRRDFVDLYFLLQGIELSQLLEWFNTKYAAAAPNRPHLGKALTYFADAELEPMPNMLLPAEWSRIRAFFETEVPKVFKTSS